MVTDDEVSMVQLCRAIKNQRALVVALAGDDPALPGEAIGLSGMQNEWKRRMHQAASGPGQDAGVPAAPAGKQQGART